MYPTNEETFNARSTPEWIKEGHLNSIQSLLKRIQDFLGYGGRLHDKSGLVMPVGSIVAFGGVSSPLGWFLCDGKEYSRTDPATSDLFAVIGTKYGTRVANGFNVPDSRGCFFRGYSKTGDIDFVPADVNVGDNDIGNIEPEFNRHGFPVRFITTNTLPAPFVINTTYYTIIKAGGKLAFATSRGFAIAGNSINITTQGVGVHTIIGYIEEDSSSRLKLSIGGNDGADLGSFQEDAFQGHYHAITNASQLIDYTAPGDYLTSGGKAYSNIEVQEPTYDGVHGAPRTSVETRPDNINVNYIIKR